MLTQSARQHLDQLYQDQGTYQPSKDIAAQLASKQILLFVGPTCVGKNAVMEAVVAANSRFKIVGTFTSRDPRPSDKGYTYYENTDAGLKSVLADIKDRRVVQYAVHPHAHTLYGSRLEDYPGEFNMADVFSSAVSQFGHLGFQKKIVLSLVSEPAVWLERFEERFPPGHPDRKARRDEAIESINWSLDQPSKNLFWVVNVDGQQQLAAQKVVALASGTSENVDDGRSLAQAMLRAAQDIEV